MEKTKKVLLITLLLIFSVVMNQCANRQKTRFTPVAEEAPDIIKTMYFKSGRFIECDIVWEGVASEICCKKSGAAAGMVVYHRINDEAFIIAYSADDVDLIRTFGESSAKEIAERDEKIQKRKTRTEVFGYLAESGSAGGTSYSDGDIIIKGFNVRRKSERQGYNVWKASFHIKNLGAPKSSIYVYIVGLTSDGYVYTEPSYPLTVDRLMTGESRHIEKSVWTGKDDKIISKWKIKKIDKVGLMKYTK